jgi:pimeloyl-ACP methyl ester carboxylesterase
MTALLLPLQPAPPPDGGGGPSETAPGPADRVTVPTTFLWPEHDPLFPRDWSDRVGEFFTDVTVTPVDGVGHFVQVEAPQVFADAVAAAAAR